jgi:hypothetical protein
MAQVVKICTGHGYGSDTRGQTCAIHSDSTGTKSEESGGSLMVNHESTYCCRSNNVQ